MEARVFGPADFEVGMATGESVAICFLLEGGPEEDVEKEEEDLSLEHTEQH